MAVEAIDEVDHGPDSPRLRLIGPADPVAPVQPAPNPQPAPPEAQRPERPEVAPPVIVRPAFPTREVMAVFEGLARALSLRLLLFLGFGAMAFGGWMVVNDPSTTKIVALCLWALMGYVPLIWLNARRA